MVSPPNMDASRLTIAIVITHAEIMPRRRSKPINFLRLANHWAFLSPSLQVRVFVATGHGHCVVKICQPP